MNSKMFRDIIKIKKFPYLVTILFLSIGWGLTHIVDRILQSPIIEYKLTVKECSKDWKILSYLITNISRDKSFQGLKFSLVLEDSKKGRFLSIIGPKLYPPIWESKSGEKPHLEPEYVEFDVKELQPNSKVGVEIKLSGDYYPDLRFSSENQTIILLKANCETFLVKNEFYIILGLIGFWFVLIVFYLYCIARNEKNSKSICHCQNE